MTPGRVPGVARSRESTASPIRDCWKSPCGPWWFCRGRIHATRVPTAKKQGRIYASPTGLLKKSRSARFRLVRWKSEKHSPLEGAVEKNPRCRKTTVIPAKAGIHFMIFAFVFAFDSDSREGASRPNPERMRQIYMAASVSSPVGREDVRAKGRRQRRKWIPAFAGKTNKSALPLVGTGRDLYLQTNATILT